MAGLDYTAIALTSAGKIVKESELKIKNLLFSIHKNHLDIDSKKTPIVSVFEDANLYIDPLNISTKTFKGNSKHGRGMYVFLKHYTGGSPDYRYYGMISCYKYFTRKPDILKSAGVELTSSAYESSFYSSETILEHFSRTYKRDRADVIATVLIPDKGWFSFKKTTNWLNNLPKEVYQYCFCHKAEGIDVVYYGPKGGTVKTVIVYQAEGWNDDNYIGMTPEIYRGYIDFVKERSDYIHADKEVKLWIANLKKNYAFRKKSVK